MKNKTWFIVFAIVVAAASITHAARTRRSVTVVDNILASPLDGYAGQVD